MLITTTNHKQIAKAILNYSTNNVVLIAVAEHTDIEVVALVEYLNLEGIRFIGGIFPKVIHNNTILEKGIVINTLLNVEHLFVLKEISKKNYQIPHINFDKNTDYSLITYVDGLTENISNYLEMLYQNYGMQTNYFGGGAGSLSLQQMPCVFSNEGVFKDAAVVGLLKTKTSIGVRHGWNKVDGPFIVTEAEGNVIKQINWENPFETYKKVVEKHAKQQFTSTNFFDIAKGYPFGILKDDAECIVRDPIMLNEANELICVGEVENHTLVDILTGTNASLIDAAKKATLQSIATATNPKKAIIIDCISRVLFLEDDFNKELIAITTTLTDKYPNISIAGAVTIGEISSYGEGFLELYNKTTVITLLE